MLLKLSLPWRNKRCVILTTFDHQETCEYQMREGLGELGIGRRIVEMEREVESARETMRRKGISLSS